MYHLGYSDELRSSETDYQEVHASGPGALAHIVALIVSSDSLAFSVEH
jgi:hypothetical protein